MDLSWLLAIATVFRTCLVMPVLALEPSFPVIDKFVSAETNNTDNTCVTTEALSSLKPMLTTIIGNRTKTSKRSRRVKRTIFYDDQDALVLLMIVFPFKFPLWDRFVATKQNQGFQAALAEFPTPITRRRLKRCIHFDEQISFWVIEVICAYKVPIIPNNIYKKDTLVGVRWKRDIESLEQEEPEEGSSKDDLQLQVPATKQCVAAADESKGRQITIACYLLDLVFHYYLEETIGGDGQ